jgi:ethanolamine utilization protein EutN
MKLGLVIGTVVCTRKDPSLDGKKLLMVQPISPDKKPIGKPLIAVDTIGAGAREVVMFVRGKEGSFPMLPEVVPTDAGITGIIDFIHVEKS